MKSDHLFSKINHHIPGQHIKNNNQIMKVEKLIINYNNINKRKFKRNI